MMGMWEDPEAMRAAMWMWEDPEAMRAAVCAIATTDVLDGPILENSTSVEIYGLKTDEGRKLNGCSGKVVSYSEEDKIYGILVDGQTRYVKLQNLKKLDCSPGGFSPGDVVECDFPLATSDSDRQLNGKKGMITRVVEGTDLVRLEVRFVQGPPENKYHLVELKPENLKRVKCNSMQFDEELNVLKQNIKVLDCLCEERKLALERRDQAWLRLIAQEKPKIQKAFVDLETKYKQVKEDLHNESEKYERDLIVYKQDNKELRQVLEEHHELWCKLKQEKEDLRQVLGEKMQKLCEEREEHIRKISEERKKDRTKWEKSCMDLQKVICEQQNRWDEERRKLEGIIRKQENVWDEERRRLMACKRA